MENSKRIKLFDRQSASYDHMVASTPAFPYCEYTTVLEKILRLAEVAPGTSVLEIGVGTANLTKLFVEAECAMWGIDYSEKMLEIARQKAPQAHFVAHDIQNGWSPSLLDRYDRIVSSYVFHEFTPEKKPAIIRSLFDHLLDDGLMVLGDISFPSRSEMMAAARQYPQDWDAEEYYWVAEEQVPQLEALGLTVDYEQVSFCAGVYRIKRK